jgi:hypothetical protein
MRHGKGRMIYNNGAVYEGDFIQDVIKGKGKSIFPNGDIYEGEWEYFEEEGNSLPSGRGKKTYANGKVVEGDWFYGQLIGE